LIILENGEVFDLSTEVSIDWNGVSLPNKPETFGTSYTFPEDLTQWTPNQIGGLYSKLGAYKGFVKVRLGNSEINVIAYTDLISAKMAQFTKQSIDAGEKRTYARENATFNEEIIELTKKLTDSKMKVKKWDTLYGLYDAQMSVLSREISRRENKF